jgi:hypothetical protein
MAGEAASGEHAGWHEVPLSWLNGRGEVVRLGQARDSLSEDCRPRVECQVLVPPCDARSFDDARRYRVAPARFHAVVDLGATDCWVVHDEAFDGWTPPMRREPRTSEPASSMGGPVFSWVYDACLGFRLGRELLVPRVVGESVLRSVAVRVRRPALATDVLRAAPASRPGKRHAKDVARILYELTTRGESQSALVGSSFLRRFGARVEVSFLTGEGRLLLPPDRWACFEPQEDPPQGPGGR